FGIHGRALDAWGIPWAVVADGPVLSPRHEVSLAAQLKATDRLLGDDERPSDIASFEDWRSYWAARGVFTLASTFGNKTTGARSGEIETYLERHDRVEWRRAIEAVPQSKSRAAALFAEMTECSPEADALYEAVVSWLALDTLVQPGNIGTAEPG